MGKNKRNLSIYRSLCLIIILLGFALRVPALGDRSLWFDEAMEYWAAGSPLSDILPTVKISLQDPPLYSILLHFWLKVGHTEFIIRFLSLAFSVAGILGVIVLSRLSFGKKASLVAGILMAVSVPDIRFAQEAGQYALMTFLLAWNLVFLFLLIKDNTWKWSILWGVSAAVAVYSYYGAAVTIGATSLVCLMYTIAKQQWGRLLKLVVGGSVGIIFIVPLAVGWMPDQLFRGPTSSAFQFTVGPYQEELKRFFTQTKTFLVYQFIGHQPNGWPWPELREWVIWLPSVFLLLTSARYKLRLPTVWFVVGLLIYYFVGRLGAYPFGGVRHSLILASLFWSCIAAGIVNHLSPNTLLSLRSILGLSLFGLIVLVARLSPIEPQEDLRSVTQLWLSKQQPGEVTYVYYGAVPGFRYQLEVAGVSEAVPSVWYKHCWQGKTVSHCSGNGIFYGQWIRHLTPEQKRQEVLETIGDSVDRLWMVFSHIYPGEDKAILAALEDTYRIVMSYFGENSALVLLEQH
jgi:uncharacterized membrane protein